MEDIPFDAEELKQTKPDDLIRYRSIFTDVINNVNTLLFKYYHNDKRIQKEALYIINMANYGINAIDEAYEEAGARDEDSDIGSLTGDFIGSEYAFNYTDAKGGNRTIDMTPSRYEAWIQVCKTPEEALRNYGRLMDLGMKEQNGQNLNGPEQKEYDMLKRLFGLALQFENSHKYMLSKGKFSQQDVDYAFALEQKERDGNIQSNMIEKSQFQTDRTLKNMINPSASASGTYQMLIMKTIFGGMKEKFTKKFPDIKYVNFDQKEMLNWVAEDSVTYIPRKKDETKTILLGIKHTTKDPNADKLKNRFGELMAKWLFQLYHQDLYEYGQTEAYLGILKTMTDEKSPLMRQIDTLAEEVMDEEKS